MTGPVADRPLTPAELEAIRERCESETLGPSRNDLDRLLAHIAALEAEVRHLTTMFEEEAYHRMAAECERDRLRDGGAVVLTMRPESASVTGAPPCAHRMVAYTGGFRCELCGYTEVLIHG